MFNIDEIRKEFPILSTKVYGKPLIYLDSGATAQKPQCVIDRVNYLHSQLNANIHRGVHHISEQVTELYEAARRCVAKYIGAGSTDEVIFTAGATASINMIAYSWGGKYIGEGDNILISEMEHHSNIVPWQAVAQSRGAQIRVLPIDDDGLLRMDLLDSLIDERTKVVAVTQASNTLGARPDLKTIIEMAHAKGAVVMVDGCQGAVHGMVDVVDLDCDFYVFSGHKLYGPTGIGVLYGKRAILDAIPPFMFGGDMVDKVSFAQTTYAPLPLKFEAGTANYIGAIGLASAIEYLTQFDFAQIEAHESGLLQMASRELLKIDGLQIYGADPNKSPIVSFNVDGVHHLDLGMILDKLGIAIRTGMHCAEPTMQHFGVTGMCRASFGMYNNEDDVRALIAGVQRAVSMLR